MYTYVITDLPVGEPRNEFMCIRTKVVKSSEGGMKNERF